MNNLAGKIDPFGSCFVDQETELNLLQGLVQNLTQQVDKLSSRQVQAGVLTGFQLVMVAIYLIRVVIVASVKICKKRSATQLEEQMIEMETRLALRKRQAQEEQRKKATSGQEN